MRNSETNFMKPLAPLVLPAVYDDVLSYEEWLAKVIQRMNEINELVNQTLADIDDLVEGMVTPRVAEIQRQVNNLSSQVTTIQGELNEVDDKISDSCAETLNQAKRYTDRVLASLGDVNGKIAEAKNEAIKAANRFSKDYTDKAVSSAQLKIERKVANQLYEMNARIDSIIKEYPLIYNPTTGWKEDMQTVVYNLYRALRYMGITAMLYDDQQMMAEEYDDKAITAIGYDTSMYKIIFKDLREMFNPFTGKLSSLRDVLGDVIKRLQWNSKTVAEFDGYECTTDEFDMSTFNSYEQDTNHYITAPSEDLKNKAYENYLLIQSLVAYPETYEIGTSAKYLSFDFCGKNYRLPNEQLDVMLKDNNDNSLFVTVYSDGYVSFAGDSVEEPKNLFAITPVKDVSELDK